MYLKFANVYNWSVLKATLLVSHQIINFLSYTFIKKNLKIRKVSKIALSISLN